MAEQDKNAGVELAARTIPWPQSISPAARAMLQAANAMPARHMPPAHDTGAWRTVIAETDAMMNQYFAGQDEAGMMVDSFTLAGVAPYRARPADHDPHDKRL